MKLLLLTPVLLLVLSACSNSNVFDVTCEGEWEPIEGDGPDVNQTFRERIIIDPKLELGSISFWNGKLKDWDAPNPIEYKETPDSFITYEDWNNLNDDFVYTDGSRTVRQIQKKKPFGIKAEDQELKFGIHRPMEGENQTKYVSYSCEET